MRVIGFVRHADHARSKPEIKVKYSEENRREKGEDDVTVGQPQKEIPGHPLGLKPKKIDHKIHEYQHKKGNQEHDRQHDPRGDQYFFHPGFFQG